MFSGLCSPSPCISIMRMRVRFYMPLKHIPQSLSSRNVTKQKNKGPDTLPQTLTHSCMLLTPARTSCTLTTSKCLVTSGRICPEAPQNHIMCLCIFDMIPAYLLTFLTVLASQTYKKVSLTIMLLFPRFSVNASFVLLAQRPAAA